jgi:hypothetical protein
VIETDTPIASAGDLPNSPIRTLRRLCASGEPITLTVNGTATVEVTDAASRGALIEFLDRLETIAAVREGLQEIEGGKGLTLEEFREAVKRKYGIPL